MVLPFYDLDILFLCYDHINNVDKSLASEPPSNSQSNSMRTKLNKTNTTLQNNINLGSNQIFAYSVTGGSLKHPPKTTHTGAWKANQISSARQYSLFHSLNMSQFLLPLLEICQGYCVNFLPLSLHHGDKTDLQPSAQRSAQNQNIIYIIKLNSPHGYSSMYWFDMLSKLHQEKLHPIYKRVMLNCRGYQLNLPSSPKIRLNLWKTYNPHTTGISSVYEKVERKHLHTSAMETSLHFFKSQENQQITQGRISRTSLHVSTERSVIPVFHSEIKDSLNIMEKNLSGYPQKKNKAEYLKYFHQGKRKLCAFYETFYTSSMNFPLVVFCFFWLLFDLTAEKLEKTVGILFSSSTSKVNTHFHRAFLKCNWERDSE
ncbi:hypothetical protein VP01_538g2 [Puccinia sorghi]|uniref:Uncharacterized protein n=1 Tax=Puccinia sorghi TaxID=27349 RepID=A0A0L6UJW2_9BASI|nr:hypothetical protein VP01_538g2 [Puccinia sorghi]